MAWPVITLSLMQIFLFYTRPTVTHPQCLDFYPPFKSNEELEFCRDHRSYGCCGKRQDDRIREEYLEATEAMNKSTVSNCESFLKDILCAECHPYAAHIYDAENPFVVEEFGIRKRHEMFPGLCTKYCKSVFDRCREVITSRARTPKFLKFIKETNAEKFCSWAVPSDQDYCIPDINRPVDESKSRPVSEDSMILCVKDFQQNLNNPLFAVHANDGTNRLFVGEQRGIIYIVLSDGRRLQTPFLNITHLILNSGSSWDERGLLGLAFHPLFKENGRFFLYYSHLSKMEDNSSGRNRDYWWHWEKKHYIRVSEFLVSENPYLADLTSERIILEVEQPEANHEGGMMLFGDDGYLYLFVGDGGGAGDFHGTYGNALNMSTLLGKVLRIDVDVFDGQPYSIPSDNPFVSVPGARPEIFAYGIRNVWRCSKDRGDEIMRYGKGRIFCGDVGQDAHEEIDIITKGGNYGWRAKEGFSCYDQQLCNSKFLKNEVLPIISYNHTVGKSIVGGYVYRGCQYPSMVGYYFYADTVTGRLFAAREDQESKRWITKEVVLGNSTFCNNGMHNLMAKTILSFGESEWGELYILSTSFPDPQFALGKLYQLVDPFKRADPRSCWHPIVTPQKLRNLLPRHVNMKPKISVKKPETCFDRLKMCTYFKKETEKCNTVKKFTLTYCQKACGYC